MEEGVGEGGGGGGGWGLISGGRFLMQGDPRGIKTVGLITDDAAREEFIFAAVSKYRLKRTIIPSTVRIILRNKKYSPECVFLRVCGSDREKPQSCD